VLSGIRLPAAERPCPRARSLAGAGVWAQPWPTHRCHPCESWDPTPHRCGLRNGSQLSLGWHRVWGDHRWVSPSV